MLLGPRDRPAKHEPSTKALQYPFQIDPWFRVCARPNWLQDWRHLLPMAKWRNGSSAPITSS